MIKLQKSKGTVWNGNGFGNSSAEWVVAKDPSISVRKVGTDWKAYQDGKAIAGGWDRKMCLEILASKRPELAA
jgi:hypothetical protein